MFSLSLFPVLALVGSSTLNHREVYQRFADAACPASYNHIPNGGFQSGTFKYWAPLDLTTGFNVSIVSSARSPDGYACRGSPEDKKHADGSYFGTTYNTIYACEGSRYNLSYWYRFHGDRSSCSLSVQVSPTNQDVYFHKAVPGRWYQRSLTFDQVNRGNSKSDTAILWVTWYCYKLPRHKINTTYIDIDDFTFTKVASLTNPACPQSLAGIANGGFEEGTLDHWELETTGTTRGQIVRPGFNRSAYALRLNFHNASSDAYHGFKLRHQLTRACANSTYDYSFAYRYVNSTMGKIPARLEMLYRILSAGLNDACFGFLNTSLEWQTIRGSCRAMSDSVPVKENYLSFRLHYAKPEKSFSDFAIEIDNVQFSLRL